MSNKILNLDLSKDPIMPAIVYGRVGDDRLQTVTVNLSRRDEVADLTGYKITFEGTTYNGKTKVFDSENASTTAAGLRKGTFDYTFPNMAFAVAGKYEQAYFSIVKDGKRDSTAGFEIYVDGNADIDAPEAETIITEYNKLVDELHRLQKQFTDNLKKDQENYIKDMVASLASINTQMSNLESKITLYETNVNKVASDAKKSISDALTDALDTISKALEEFQRGNFYNKPEADERFAKKADLTKENVQLGNVDNYPTANQTDAETGLAPDKFMTPLRTKQHVTSRIATQEEAEIGESDEKLMTPRTTRQSIEKRSVLLAGDQDVDGKKNFLVMPTVGGKEFLTTDDFPLADPLWSGISYLRAANTITLTKSLSDCKSGIVLKFNPYNTASGSAYTSQTSWCFIPKHHVTTNASGQNTFCPIFKQDGTFVGAKVITVSPTKITGADVNATGALLGYVLTGIYEV